MKYQAASKTAQGKQSESPNGINLINFERNKLFTVTFKLDDNIINKFEFNIYNRKLDGSISVGMGSWLFRLMQ